MKRIAGRLGFGVVVLFMLAGAVGHVVSPEAYAPMVPSFIPLTFANWAAFIAELAVGILLLVPKTRAWGGLGFAALMVAFLPLHVWDLTKPEPVMGSQAAAMVRLVVQGVFIWGGWKIYETHQAKRSNP